jgi:hypothetical protein
MNSIHPDLNPLEVIIVCDHYEQRGVKHYDLHRGNECIWATRGQISEYFVFREGRLVDIQMD